MIKNFLVTVMAFISIASYCQSFENKGWIFLTHKQKLSKKFDLLAEFQVRSSDKLERVETVLIRGAASYNFNKDHSIALGYVYKADWEDAADKLLFTLEHRLYEQYLFNGTIRRTEITTRFRLEQRFVQEDDQFIFSQRARGFLSVQIPLAANKDFTRGVYTTFQNELFVNVYKKENVKNSFFDQNRVMGSIGYRWNSSIDTQVGYIYWRQKETAGISNSNIIQLMITTEM